MARNAPSNGPRLRRSPEDLKNDLSSQVEQDAIDRTVDAMNKPIAYRGNIMREHSKQFLSRMDATGKQWQEHLDSLGWQQDMEQSFENEMKTQLQLSSIFNKLGLDAPDESGKPAHPYITLQKESVRGMKGSLITARVSTEIYSDMKYLESILSKDVSADQRQVTEGLLGALREYAAQDPGRMAAEAWRHQQNNHVPDQVFGDVGRVAGVLIFGSIAIFGGLRALFKRELPSLGVVLAGCITGLLAFPGATTSLFGGKDQQSLAEIDKTLNKPTFKRAAKEHDMHGPRWKRFADAQMKREPSLMSFNEKMARGAATDAEKNAIREQYFGDGVEARHFDALMKNAESYASVANLSTMKDAEARNVALLYIDKGAGRFIRDTEEDVAQFEQKQEIA